MVSRGDAGAKDKNGRMVGEWECEVVELGELKVSKNDGNLDFLG